MKKFSKDDKVIPTVLKNNTRQPLDLLDIILDRDNTDPIVLMDQNGRQICFEQVAVIPYDEKDTRKLYVILKPLDKVDGIEDNEAVVCVCEEDPQGNTVLRIEENDDVAIAVFQQYYRILEEALKNIDNK